MPKNSQKFNQSEYVNSYNKQHYTSCSIKVKNEFMELLANYSQNMDISKTALIQKCVKYCYDNMIDVSNVKLSSADKSGNSKD